MPLFTPPTYAIKCILFEDIMTFTAPAKSIQFLLNHSVDLDAILSLPAFAEVNRELISDILAGAADFAENVWAPTNWDGDQNFGHHPNLSGPRHSRQNQPRPPKYH